MSAGAPLAICLARVELEANDVTARPLPRAAKRAAISVSGAVVLAAAKTMTRVVSAGAASAARADEAGAPAPHTSAARAATRAAPAKAAEYFATSLGTTGAPMLERS